MLLAKRSQRRFIPARAGNTGTRRSRPAWVPVHPRAGGEHSPRARRTRSGAGSSPRGRGTLCCGRGGKKHVRFIPARAGNTARPSPRNRRPPVHPRAGGNTDPSRSPRRTTSVHPRAGGEHSSESESRSSGCGSSPRGRGTLSPPGIYCQGLRFIPARAGNTGKRVADSGPGSVHPRAGGEHTSSLRRVEFRTGSSPRGRGTHERSKEGARQTRFIPARAGNTRSFLRCWRGRTVHPRAGGEHKIIPRQRSPVDGSSPRGRGTRQGDIAFAADVRFIPARAGNTFGLVGPTSSAPVHPRAGGEHASGFWATLVADGSSPRGRGTLIDGPILAHLQRFIPARAGNTVSPSQPRRDSPVHPRAGGEHEDCCRVAAADAGSSPRGRGTLLATLVPQRNLRFIPARAGNTGRPNTAVINPPVHPRAGGEHMNRRPSGSMSDGSSPRGRGTHSPPTA